MVRELCIGLGLSREHVDDADFGWSLYKQVTRDISSSLVGNKQLQDLCIGSIYDVSWDPAVFDIGKLLCDILSTESISNSNHTLNRLSIFEYKYLYECRRDTFEETCLVLNQNKNKAKVIRDKILQFYFVGDFDVSPFSICHYPFYQKSLAK